MTTQSLKLFLCGLLPDKIYLDDGIPCWIETDLDLGVQQYCAVQSVHMPYICWLVEQTLTHRQQGAYFMELIAGHHSNPTLIYFPAINASWEKKAIALHKVLGK